MVINIQAFNARGADNRRIYEALDDFQSRKPIDVIASNRPILILDEPQKMEGGATKGALPKFKSLFIMRYSATHRTQHTRKRKHPFDRAAYRLRNVVERTFCRLDDWRRVATRYDKLAQNFLAAMAIASIVR